MKRWIGLALLVFIGAAGWRIGGSLSPDALSMAVGVLFGVMAGVPTALLVMAGSRRRHSDERANDDNARSQPGQITRLPGQMPGQMGGQMNGWQMPYAQQPPIIVLAGPQGLGAQPPAQTHQNWLPQDPPERKFTVVGDRETLTEDW